MRKLKWCSTPLVAALAMLGCHIFVPMASATVIVNDGFDSAGATTGNDASDPLDVAFTPTGTGTAISLVTSGGVGTGNALDLSAAATFATTFAPFSTTSLSIGDSITLNFDFRLTQAPVANGAGFRFALESTTDGSYIFQGGTGTAAGGSFVRLPTAGTAGAGGIALTTAGTAAAINDQTAHNVSLTISRLNSTTVGLTANYAGSIFTTTDATSPVLNFNRLEFGDGNAQVNFRVDNVSVITAVPEPVTSALLICGLGMLVLKRRRH